MKSVLMDEKVTEEKSRREAKWGGLKESRGTSGAGTLRRLAEPDESHSGPSGLL